MDTNLKRHSSRVSGLSANSPGQFREVKFPLLHDHARLAHLSATACGGPRGDVLGQLLHVDPVWQHLEISGIVNIVCVPLMTAKSQQKTHDVQAPVGAVGIHMHN